jgi:hypothetical protein
VRISRRVAVLASLAAVATYLPMSTAAVAGAGTGGRQGVDAGRIGEILDVDLDLDLATLAMANVGEGDGEATVRLVRSGRFALQLGTSGGGAVLEAVGMRVVQDEATVEMTFRVENCAQQRLWAQSYLLEDARPTHSRRQDHSEPYVANAAEHPHSGSLFREEYPAHVLGPLLASVSGGGDRGLFGPNPVDKLQFLHGAAPELAPLNVPGNVDLLQDLQQRWELDRQQRRGNGSETGNRDGGSTSGGGGPAAEQLRRNLLAGYDAALKAAAGASDKTGWDPAPLTPEAARSSLLDR